jgi:ATP-dependent exoDNAse (exonuclease V) alpha subunit
MAIFSLNASVISRGKGHSTTAAAAYRARCAIMDERTGQLNDYSRKHGDLAFEGLYAPKDAPAWSIDREQLWNAVERMEKRKDARLARDFKIALPHELTPEQNRWLVQDFVRENFTRKGYVADVAIHAPHEQGDDRNIHAHILVTDRQLTPDGFTATKDRAIQSKDYLQGLRESWEHLANRHLERHGHEARIDHRTLEAQGIEREPGLHMGKDATAAERHGRTTERGERQDAITARNRTVQELSRELKELQRQQGIAETFAKALDHRDTLQGIDARHGRDEDDDDERRRGSHRAATLYDRAGLVQMQSDAMRDLREHARLRERQDDQQRHDHDRQDNYAEMTDSAVERRASKTGKELTDRAQFRQSIAALRERSGLVARDDDREEGRGRAREH